MTVYYVDTDGSGATAPYDTWAKAAQTLKTITDLPPAAGSTVYIQGAANDSYTAAYQIVAGTLGAPIRYIGCVNGTTAEPPAAADMSTKSTGTKIECITTGGIDLKLGDGTDSAIYLQGLQLESIDEIQFDDYCRTMAVDCTLVSGANLTHVGNGWVELIDCAITPGNIFFIGGTQVRTRVVGGTVSTGNGTYIVYDSNLNTEFIAIGVDFTGSTGTTMSFNTGRNGTHFKNCRFPASWTFATRTSKAYGWSEAVGCNATSTLAAGSSYQDYEFVSYAGDIDNSTEFRTGGADDGATGTFSLAMAPTANNQEGSNANLKTKWMKVWVAGGTRTLTVYITNGTGDLNRDEISCEFLTPNSADTSDHTLTFDPSIADRSEVSATIVTDDTDSTWDTNNTHKQKFTTGSITVGYTGWAYARVSYGKPSGAVVYVDPKIEVT